MDELQFYKEMTWRLIGNAQGSSDPGTRSLAESKVREIQRFKDRQEQPLTGDGSIPFDSEPVKVRIAE
jgi:hypothetical protein